MYMFHICGLIKANFIWYATENHPYWVLTLMLTLSVYRFSFIHLFCVPFKPFIAVKTVYRRLATFKISVWCGYTFLKDDSAQFFFTGQKLNPR